MTSNDYISKRESGVFGLYKQIKDEANKNILIRIDHTDHLQYHCSKCGQEMDVKLIDGGAQVYFKNKYTRKLMISLKCRCTRGWLYWRKFYVDEKENTIKNKKKINIRDFVYEHPEATAPLSMTLNASNIQEELEVEVEEENDTYTKLLKESLEIEKQYSEILLKRSDVEKRLARYEQFRAEK